jgi:uncharacterized Zn finger protein
MLRALAAELSDPARFTRAKAYARDGLVLDIEIEPGVVRGEVQGSRYDPYVTELHVGGADRDVGPTRPEVALLIPDRDEIAASCSCPDSDTWGGAFCKHVLATVLVLADEITVEPELLAHWRSAPPAATRSRRARAAEPDVDVLAPLLGARAPLPDPPRLPPRLPVAMPAAAGEAAAVLADALAVLRSSSPSQ